MPTAGQKKEFGKRLKRMRQLRGINQNELALRVGMAKISQPRIAKFEAGAPPTDDAVTMRLAEVLGTTYEYLWGLAQPTAEPPYPAWQEFLRAHDREVAMAPEWAIDTLRKLRLPDGRQPTVGTYLGFLMNLVSSTTTDKAEESP